MFAMLLLLAAPSAEACGLSGKSHVVGWNPAGDQVLLRLEKDNDEGGVYEIELAAFDLAQRKRLQAWTILTPEDQGDRNKRGARWKAAEKDILAMGIEVIPTVPPVEEDAEVGGRKGWTLAGAPAIVTLDRETYDEGMMQRFQLNARKGDTTWPLGVVHEGMNSGCGGYYPQAWRAPSGKYLLLLDQNFVELSPAIVSVDDLTR